MSRECEICGKDITGKDYRTRTCGRSCGNSLASGNAWTPMKRRQLAQMYAAYPPPEVVPVNEIAKHLDKTPSAVKFMAHKMGLTDRKRSRYDQAGIPKPWQRTIEERPCLQCGKVFLPTDNSIKHCSRTCAGLNRKSHGGGYGVSGKRDDLGGLYVRSKWEANYARYLNWLIEQGEIDRWEYEPETFWFPIKRGVRHYTPDFKVWSNGEYEWHEVKGYMDKKSKTKLNRFRIYHPGENDRLRLVQKAEMKDIRDSVGMLIPEWEV